METYNGEYFVQIEDPLHMDKIGVGSGCYIDQVFGQTWAHWVGLGRLFDREQQAFGAAGVVEIQLRAGRRARFAKNSCPAAGTPRRAMPG